MADLYGLLAEFATPERLLAAVGKTRQQGYCRIEAFTPFPVDGLAEATGFHERRLPFVAFVGGVFGLAVAMAMQSYVAVDYPLDVGGRALFPWAAFSVVGFELTILFSALFVITDMLWRDRLPRLSHPLFEVPDFHLASRTRFFLLIERSDPRFRADETQSFLKTLQPVSITAVPL